MSKCDFFLPRVEYVGHDLTASGNCPAQSKFQLIKDWPLPPHGVSLLSFIGLCSFYSNYVPWFESNIKPLRRLQRLYHCQPVPVLAWSPMLVELFESCKDHLITSPLLQRYDTSKPTFLKTDWSAGGMVYILMQPDNSPESLAAILHLESTGEFLFELKPSGPRLMPIIFNSRANLEHEKHYHSFVGDIACGRWAISRLRKYLWGILFYWLCDCSAIKEILEYNGSIHQIKRWSQELLAYEFVILHRLARMMLDVDGLARFMDPLVHRYTITASRLYTEDVTERPFAYSYDVFHSCNNPRHVSASDALSLPITTSSITSISALYHSPIKFSPVFPITINPSSLLPGHSSRVSSFPVIPPSSITWISFDSVVNPFSSILSTQGYNTLQHFVCESNPLHFSIASTLSPSALIFYTTFHQFITSLQSQLSLAATHIPVVTRHSAHSFPRYTLSNSPHSLLSNNVPPSSVLPSSQLPLNDNPIYRIVIYR